MVTGVGKTHTKKEGNQTNIFSSTDIKDTIYVNWAQTRFERNRKLRELYN